MGAEPKDFSYLVVRTTDGLRVAVAGLPHEMPVEVYGIVLDVMNVGELRALATVAEPLCLSIPYRLLPDSRVYVRPAERGER